MRARQALALLVALSLALTWSQAALAAPAWYDADAGVPATANLADIASDGGSPAVIAVGRDAPAAPAGSTDPAPLPHAVAYRLAGGAWYADTVAVPDGATDSQLDAVAIAGGVAWAIGSYKDATGAKKPLVVRATGLAAADPIVWTAVAAWPADVLPLSIALGPRAPSGATGFVGDDQGKVRPVTDDGAAAQTVASPLDNQAGSGPLAGVAVYGPDPGRGFAVAGYGSGTTPRFFAIAPSATDSATTAMSPQPAVFDTQVGSGTKSTVDAGIVGVAAVDSTHAFAVDAASLWQLSASGVWQQQDARSPANTNAFGDWETTLTRVAARTVGDTIQSAIAGSSAFGGAVWRLDPASGRWTEDILTRHSSSDTTPILAINGVALAADGAIWAAGDAGTLRHFYDKPLPPPPPDPTPDPGSGGTGGTDPGTGGADTGATEAPPADNSSPPPPDTTPAPPVTVSSGTPIVAIVPVTKPRPKPVRRPAAPVLHNVAVRRTAKGPVVSFDLTSRAYVTVIAKNGSKVLAKSKTKRCKKGHNQILVPYAGRKLPPQLKIIVRPIAKPRSK